MRPIVILFGTAAVMAAASAQVAFPPTAVEIERYFHGSGEPDKRGYENALAVTNDVYHAPQFMPGSPTAASIWARVIEVPCRLEGGIVRCKGYHWHPDLGRGEYLYFRPVIVAPAAAAGAPPPLATLPSALERPSLSLATSLGGAAEANLARKPERPGTKPQRAPRP